MPEEFVTRGAVERRRAVARAQRTAGRDAAELVVMWAFVIAVVVALGMGLTWAARHWL